jgi:hypothetical protein
MVSSEDIDGERDLMEVGVEGDEEEDEYEDETNGSLTSPGGGVDGELLMGDAGKADP